MQGVIFKCTRHECSVFVNLRPLLLCIRSRHQFFLPEKYGIHTYINTQGKIQDRRDECVFQSLMRASLPKDGHPTYIPYYPCYIDRNASGISL